MAGICFASAPRVWQKRVPSGSRCKHAAFPTAALPAVEGPSFRAEVVWGQEGEAGSGLQLLLLVLVTCK